MTKNKAIELAYIEITKHNFDKDAVQHCFEFLLKKPDDFILTLHIQEKLVNYIFKVIYSTIKFTNSDFNRLKCKEVLLDDLPDVEQNDTFYEINLSNIYWFDKDLLILYAENDCNYSKVNKLTKIPIDSIRRAVNRAIKKYKENEEIRQRVFRRK